MAANSKRRSILKAAAAAPLLAGVPWASAQGAWPNRPVKIVVGVPPGSINDALARTVAQHLTKVFGQSFVIENKGGAGGMIGTEAVARAPADGYTLMLGTSSQLVMNVALYKPSFNIETDIVSVAMLSKSRLILVVHPSLGVKTLKDFIALAKANPGKYNYGTSGPGGILHVAAERFLRAADLKLQPVHYRGAGPAQLALKSGEFQMYVDGLGSAIPAAKAGDVIPLAISERRVAALPNVPTFEEQGVMHADGYTWNSIMAPRGTPADIIRRLNVAVNAALESPESQAVIERYDSTAYKGSTPESTDAFWRNELKTWLPIVRSLNITMT